MHMCVGGCARREGSVALSPYIRAPLDEENSLSSMNPEPKHRPTKAFDEDEALATLNHQPNRSPKAITILGATYFLPL